MDKHIIEKLDFEKGNGLIPCIVQDENTRDILMLAYVNKEALELSISTKKATFFSRSRNEIWIKGNSHEMYLTVRNIIVDCDEDAIIMLVDCPFDYNICHTGMETCFGDKSFSLEYLNNVISAIDDCNTARGYTKGLLDDPARCAQKVIEEAGETAIESMKGIPSRLDEEAADLLYHLIVLLNAHKFSIYDVIERLKERHKK